MVAPGIQLCDTAMMGRGQEHTMALALGGALCVLFQSSAMGQCTARWLPGDAVPGTDMRVSVATMWDPDGAGPEPAKFVVGGVFAAAGDVASKGIAAYEPETGRWSGFGTGLTGGLITSGAGAFLALPNGDLIAGGGFTAAGGVQCSNIARWRQGAWQAMGSIDGGVRALAVLTNGHIVAGGQFTSADGLPCKNLAIWDGLSWRDLAGGTNGSVWALAALPDGGLVVGGDFVEAGGIACNRIAQLDATNGWSALGSGIETGSSLFATVRALAVLPDGRILVGGEFGSSGGIPTNSIARWNGVSWEFFAGVGLNRRVNTLLVTPTGGAIVGGDFTSAGGVAANMLARFEGGTWSPLDAGVGVPLGSGAVFGLAVLPTSELIAAGQYGATGAVSRANVFRQRAGAWVSTNEGEGNTIGNLVYQDNGDLIASGVFASRGGVAAQNIARFSGGRWFPIGNGIAGIVGPVVSLPNGDLAAVAYSAPSDGARIVRWNGNNWSDMTTRVVGQINALCVLANGDLAAGGFFGVNNIPRLARWNGSDWVGFGSGISNLSNSQVFSIVQMHNGDVVVGGSFLQAGGLRAHNIARWDGAAWTAMGPGTGGGFTTGATVESLAVAPNGDVIAGGRITTASGVSSPGVARWDGAAWRAMPGLIGSQTDGPSVRRVGVLASGEVFVAGSFGLPGHAYKGLRVARWDGSAWQDTGSISTWGNLRGFAVRPDGEVAISGAFATVEGVVSAYLMRYAVNGAPPSITRHPEPAIACPSASAEFFVTTIGTGPFAHTWEVLDATIWRTLNVQPTILSCGAAAAVISQNGETASISVTRCSSLGTGPQDFHVRCRVQDSCGASTSNETIYRVCPADFDCSNQLGIPDVFAFLNAWLSAEPRADFNGVDGLSTQDVFDFLTQWLSGC